MTETKLRLLIVDDDPVDRETCRRLLRQHSEYTYDFLEADLGEDGLTLCQDFHRMQHLGPAGAFGNTVRLIRIGQNSYSV